MIVMEYVAKFTELAHFADDYVATYMAKVRRFENGLMFSIQGKIVGLCLQDMDSLVEMALTIEKEIEDARGIRPVGLVRRVRIGLLLVRERGRRLLLLEHFRDEAVANKAKVRPRLPARQDK